MPRRLTAILLSLIFLLLFNSSGYSLDRATLKWMRAQYKISSISVTGGEAFSKGEVKGKMYSKVWNVWHGLKGTRGSRLRRETLNRDTLEIKYLYLREGFLGVRVRESFELDVEGDDSTIIVMVALDEGKRFTIGPSSVGGNYPTEWQHDLERSLKKLKLGKPLNPFLVHEVTFDMRAFLADRGYPRARIDNLIDTAACVDSCPIQFKVETDSLVHYGNIQIQGSERFPEHVVRRELKIKTGKSYRQTDLVDSRRRLYESGYFTSFNIQEQVDSTRLYNPDYIVRVRERKAYFLTASTGPVGQSNVDDLLWSATFGFGKRNFLKTRQASFSADYFFSTGSNARLRRNVYSLKYTDPWFLGIRMPTTFGFELRPKVKSEYEQEYDIASWAISVSTLRKFGRYIRTDFGMEYESVDITGIPPEDIPVIKQENGVSERRKVYFSFRRDSRDHLFIPRHGSVTEASLEYVGGFLGGDDDFLGIRGSWSRFQSVWPGWVSATRLKGGWVRPFGNSATVPANDRLYLGGANTVRGFKENSLGPLADDGTAVGARYTLLFNQEFRWKTIQVLTKIPFAGGLFKNLPLWQSVFFDMGNGFNALEDIKLRNFAYSYGTGVQLVSPAGPIRLDYARRITTDRYAFDYRWHFTILYAF